MTAARRNPLSPFSPSMAMARSRCFVPTTMVWCLVVLLCHTHPPALAVGPGTCYEAVPFAQSYAGIFLDGCATDTSGCRGAMACDCEDGTGDGTLANAACRDGCAWGPIGSGIPPVVRQFSALRQQVGAVGDFSSFYATMFSFTHVYNSETTPGVLSYTYEPNADNFRAPAMNKFCSISLDSQQCSCTQHWCNAEQTSYANVLDCSGLPGGAIIDLCLTPQPITVQSSKMEILFWVPQLYCDDPSLLPQVQQQQQQQQPQLPPPAQGASASSSGFGNQGASGGMNGIPPAFPSSGVPLAPIVGGESSIAGVSAAPGSNVLASTVLAGLVVLAGSGVLFW